MTEYHKIQSIFKRDMTSKRKTLIEGEWTLPKFEYLAGNAWAFTEKVDGTNIRVIFKDGGVTFGGRTEDAQIPAKLVERLNERFLPLAVKFGEVFADGSAVLYGEGYGAKIQKGGGNYRADQDFVLFYVRVGDLWLQRSDVEDVAQKLGIDVVPIIGEGTLHDAIASAKSGIVSMWGDFHAEAGIGLFEAADRVGDDVGIAQVDEALIADALPGRHGAVHALLPEMQQLRSVAALVEPGHVAALAAEMVAQAGIGRDDAGRIAMSHDDAGIRIFGDEFLEPEDVRRGLEQPEVRGAPRMQDLQDLAVPAVGRGEIRADPPVDEAVGHGKGAVVGATRWTEPPRTEAFS